jgi:hypothetical protein
MIVSKDPYAGAIVTRPKHSRWGDRYGTMLPNRLVAHTTPERGKHVSSFEEFCAGKPAKVHMLDRSVFDNLAATQRAVQDLGRPYHAITDNCEQDVTRVHTGVPNSPSVVKWGIMVGIAILFLGFGSNS